MAKAAAEGIPLGDYIKFHAPEPFVRGQLDRGELRYAWTEINGNKRASDDGGPLPARGWWPRPIFTPIDRETSEVRGNAQFAPFFPPMFFVRVYPNHASRKARPRGRPSGAPSVLAEALARLQGKDRANIERRRLGHFLEELSIWLAKEDDPNARPMKPKTIGDHLRKDEEIQAIWPKTWRRRRR